MNTAKEAEGQSADPTRLFVQVGWWRVARRRDLHIDERSFSLPPACNAWPGRRWSKCSTENFWQFPIADTQQCSGSVTFWDGSRFLDLYTILRTRIQTLLFSSVAFQKPTKNCPGGNHTRLLEWVGDPMPTKGQILCYSMYLIISLRQWCSYISSLYSFWLL